MDDELKSLDSASAPARVSFSTRRSRLPSRRLLVAEPRVRCRWSAWLSLQGRLFGAEAATSARSIKGGLGREEAAAWEMFSPMERVLLVAIVAAAAKESRREERIAQLQRSVDIRDEVLLNMQKKLEGLCEEMNSKDEPKKANTFCVCGNEVIGMVNSKGEMYEMGVTEPEERRMSDLSDFSSVTSSVDIQLSTLAQEQDFYNLRKECEEKDAAIKELTAAAHESSISGSKRILELEEIIRRKNMVITKLKKDMVVLEQKVIQLTRQRRPSTALNAETTKLPAMATNLLFDMSSSSPSSSDSDSPVERGVHPTQAAVKNQIHSSTKSLNCLKTLSCKLPKQKSTNLDKENFTINRGILIDASRQKSLVSSSGEKKRRTQQETIGIAQQKRWA